MFGGWLLKAFLFVLGATCYALLGIFSQLSKSDDGSYAYSMPTVVLTAEAVKLCISSLFLSQERKTPSSALHVLSSTSPRTWALWTVPSALYSLNNNLDMLYIQYMDPATAQVLVQLKIITTAIAWWLVFQKPLGHRKWLALLFLFLGCVGAGWPKESTDGSMYIKPFGAVLIGVYVFISATAGVYNEWLYKVGGSEESIHASNVRLYAIGVCFNFMGFVAGIPVDERLTGLFGLWRGYNVYTFGLVGTYACMGLLIAQVMKHFDSIVKLFISGSSMYVSAVLSFAIFGLQPALSFILSLGIVTLAILMFNAADLPAGVALKSSGVTVLVLALISIVSVTSNAELIPNLWGGVQT